MCGILLYYSKKSYLKEDEILSSLNSLNSIKHRGPDSEGAVVINTFTNKFNIINTYETVKIKLKT